MVAWIVRICSWLWSGLTFLLPFANVLWGVSVYSGIIYSVYLAVDSTVHYISNLNTVFSQWASNVGDSIASLFSAVNSSSFFQLMSYVTSLDVPFEFIRSCSDWFLRVCLSYVIGGALAFVEIAAAVLGILFVRSRVNKISKGFGVGGGGSPS